jgi:putative ABC transport system substrate-binding protein
LADLRGFAPNRRAAPDFAPNLERLKSTRDAGPLGLTLVPAEARGLDALEQAFATMIGDCAQALTVLSDGVLFNCLLTRADEVIE